MKENISKKEELEFSFNDICDDTESAEICNTNSNPDSTTASGVYLPDDCKPDTIKHQDRRHRNLRERDICLLLCESTENVFLKHGVVFDEKHSPCPLLRYRDKQE